MIISCFDDFLCKHKQGTGADGVDLGAGVFMGSAVQ